MKFKILVTGLSLVFAVCIINGQSKLHIPKEIQNTYKKETRSKDGNPGVNYWQNFVDYKIDVEVVPKTREVIGKETIIFSNNSPDELSSIVIRLYYDVFKTGNERGMQVDPGDIGNGVDIKSIKVNGVAYDLANRQLVQRAGTNMELQLQSPLRSGEQLTLDFSWEQKVPLTVRRTGAMDPSSFFVAYWYPQVAVYDDIFGWDRINYTFDTEFYNNLANFDVNITAPDNFLVWATGTLENSQAVLPGPIYERYTAAKKSDDVVKVVTSEDLSNLKLKSNTWNYKATEVSDFAFALSDHYAWDALSLRVGDKNVLIGTAYPAEQKDRYTQVTKVQQKAMKHFSEDAPGVPYPYPEFTTFIGLRSGGMEFPMMANNQGPNEMVTIHEMFHTYLPMYVRVNERRFTWMEEGWADFFTSLVMHNFFKDKNDKSSFYSNFKSGMQGMIGSIGDLPTVTSSQYMGNNFGYHSYKLPGFTYALLYQHFGEQRFLEIFREYVRRWAKKSPMPYDFFYTFEDVSGENLNWIWDSWYFKMGYPDVAIDKVENGKLIIKRIGDRPVPVSVKISYENSAGEEPTEFSTIINTEVWKNDNRTHSFDLSKNITVKSIVLNSDFPDFNELDNYYPPLKERYKAFQPNEGIFGVYKMRQFPVDVKISREDGVFRFDMSQGGMGGYLLPTDANNYVSTDGTFKLKFLEQDSVITGIEIHVASFGMTITGAKKK